MRCFCVGEEVKAVGARHDVGGVEPWVVQDYEGKMSVLEDQVQQLRAQVARRANCVSRNLRFCVGPRSSNPQVTFHSRQSVPTARKSAAEI
jgi:hypothetical protein